MSLAALLSLIDVLSGPQQIKYVISLLPDTDISSKLLAVQVHDLRSCKVISRSIVQDLGRADRTSSL